MAAAAASLPRRMIRMRIAVVRYYPPLPPVVIIILRWKFGRLVPMVPIPRCDPIHKRATAARAFSFRMMQQRQQRQRQKMEFTSSPLPRYLRDRQVVYQAWVRGAGTLFPTDLRSCTYWLLLRDMLRPLLTSLSCFIAKHGNSKQHPLRFGDPIGAEWPGCSNDRQHRPITLPTGSPM